jgi:hypothetical protein
MNMKSTCFQARAGGTGCTSYGNTRFWNMQELPTLLAAERLAFFINLLDILLGFCEALMFDSRLDLPEAALVFFESC